MKSVEAIELEWLGSSAFRVRGPRLAVVFDPPMEGGPSAGALVEDSAGLGAFTLVGIDLSGDAPPSTVAGAALTKPDLAFVLEGEGFRCVHVGRGIAGPAFEAMRERGSIDVALLPGWDPHSGRTPLEALAHFRVMCDILRPRLVFPHAPYDAANHFHLDVKADFARSGQGATVVFGPPGVRFTP